MRYVRGNDEAGEKIDVRDPLSQRFAAMAESATESSDWVASILAMREVFPEQVAKILAEPVTQAYLELEKHGAHYSVRKVIRLHGCHA
jgi:mannitol-1-phosphate/altronate dehydrogenase